MLIHDDHPLVLLGRASHHSLLYVNSNTRDHIKNKSIITLFFNLLKYKHYF
jgi:hypothetical protein